MRDQAIRERVVQLCLELSRQGFLAGTGGNVAVRTDDDHFAVTASAMDYHRMQPADVCVMRLSDLLQVDGERTPSVESSLHARVLRARPDCSVSIHTHQPVASACALLGQSITVYDPMLWASVGAIVPVVGYAPSGTGWLASKLAAAIRPDRNAYLMLNHGVLCCGPDVDTAVRTVENLERVCQRHLSERIAARATAEPARREALQGVLSLLAHASPHIS
jgi:L-fuculose-phosphate aldolase